MRQLVLGIIFFLILSVVFSVAVIFIPASAWDAIVVLFSALIFLKKKPATVAMLTLAAALFFEIISNTPAGTQTFSAFASLLLIYSLRNYLMNLNHWVEFIVSLVSATLAYRFLQIILAALSQDFAAGFGAALFNLINAPQIIIALSLNIFLSFVFVLAYNAGKKQFFAQFLLSQR